MTGRLGVTHREAIERLSTNPRTFRKLIAVGLLDQMPDGSIEPASLENLERRPPPTGIPNGVITAVAQVAPATVLTAHEREKDGSWRDFIGWAPIGAVVAGRPVTATSQRDGVRGWWRWSGVPNLLCVVIAGFTVDVLAVTSVDRESAGYVAWEVTEPPRWATRALADRRLPQRQGPAIYRATGW